MERELFLEGTAFRPDGIVAVGILSSNTLYNSIPQLNTNTVSLTVYSQWDAPQRVEMYVHHLNAEDILHDLKLLPR